MNQLSSKYAQYRQPSVQQIVIKQKEPIINFNLSQLVQNYSSLIIQNQEEIYYQIVQADIPEQDSLIQIFGSNRIKFHMQIIPHFSYSPDKNNSNSYNFSDTVTRGIDDEHIISKLNLENFYLNLVLTIPAHKDGIIEPQDIAEQIRQQLLDYANLYTIQYIKELREKNYNQDVGFDNQRGMVAFFNCLSDFVYDKDSGKYCFLMEPTFFQISSDDFPELQIPKQQIYVQAFDIFFFYGETLTNSSSVKVQAKYDLRKEKAERMFANIMGNDSAYPPAFDIKHTKYENGFHQVQDLWSYKQYYSFFRGIFHEENPITKDQRFAGAYQTNFFSNSKIIIDNNHTFDQYYDSVMQGQIRIYSSTKPRFNLAQEVAIKSSSDTPFWTNQGERMSYVAIVGREDRKGTKTDYQTLSGQTPLIRAQLSSIRSMRLELVDYDEPKFHIHPAKDFLIKLNIYFPI